MANSWCRLVTVRIQSRLKTSSSMCLSSSFAMHFASFENYCRHSSGLFIRAPNGRSGRTIVLLDEHYDNESIAFPVERVRTECDFSRNTTFLTYFRFFLWIMKMTFFELFMSVYRTLRTCHYHFNAVYFHLKKLPWKIVSVFERARLDRAFTSIGIIFGCLLYFVTFPISFFLFTSSTEKTKKCVRVWRKQITDGSMCTINAAAFPQCPNAQYAVAQWIIIMILRDIRDQTKCYRNVERPNFPIMMNVIVDVLCIIYARRGHNNVATYNTVKFQCCGQFVARAQCFSLKMVHNGCNNIIRYAQNTKYSRIWVSVHAAKKSRQAFGGVSNRLRLAISVRQEENE